MRSQRMGAILRYHRTRCEMSVRKLAKEAGITPSFLSKVERGYDGISKEKLTELFLAVGLEQESIDKLLPRCETCGQFRKDEANGNPPVERAGTQNAGRVGGCGEGEAGDVGGRGIESAEPGVSGSGTAGSDAV